MADAEKLANYNRILGAACEQGTLVRRTWYSDIYKVMLKIGQNQRYWNIECISIPFDEDRKNFILKRCGFSEEALPNFEFAVRESLKNAYVLSKSFIRDNSQEQKDRKDFPVLPYGLLGCEKSEKRFEMKVVYECTERLLDCTAPGGEISAIELLNQLGKINGVLKRMGQSRKKSQVRSLLRRRAAAVPLNRRTGKKIRLMSGVVRNRRVKQNRGLQRRLLNMPMDMIPQKNPLWAVQRKR